MAIRKLATSLPKECLAVWQEFGQILKEMRDRILAGEAGGTDMSQARDVYGLLCNNFCKKGTQHYPQEFASFCETCDLTLPEPVMES
jgi:hypothetical protein